MSDVLKKTKKKKWHTRQSLAEVCLSLSREGHAEFSVEKIYVRLNERAREERRYITTNYLGQVMRYVAAPTIRSGISFTRNRNPDSRIYFVTCEEELENFIHLCNRIASNPGGAPNAQ